MYKINPFTFSYNKNETIKKLFSHSPIEIKSGELIAITGSSGAGKSTLLKLLKGIIPEYSTGLLEGEILFQGENLVGLNFEKNLRRILYLFQNPYSQILHPTTEEEFLFSLENFNFSSEEIRQRGEKLEKIFGLENLWGKKTKELSHGECQKLVLASLVAVDPEVLLLDEPTAFLDPKARREVYSFLKLLKKDHTVIIVDHHLEEIDFLVDRYLFIDDFGELKAREGLPDLKANVASLNMPLMDSGDAKKNSVVLKVNHLNFSYEKNKNVLRDIQFQACGGEIVAIRGVNGAGKSTFLKLCSGIMKPNSGTIELDINDKTIKHSKLHDYIGLVFQNPETHFFYDTIIQELNQSFKKDKPSAAFVESFLKDVDLKKSPFLLSEGEKRRLSILMTVFMGKRVIFYDEPTFGQDLKSRSLIASLMKEIQKMGILQVMISHDDSFIKETVNRVYVLDQGRLDVVS